MHDTWAYRGLTRLNSARGKEASLPPPMFEFQVFRKQMYCIEENTCDIVWTFWCPRSHSTLHVVIRRPGNCSPLVTPLRPYKCQLVLLGFEKKKYSSCCGKWRHRFWIFDQNSTTACSKYSLDTASASMNIIHLLRYVAGVRTAAFVTVYVQISFLGSFLFSFFVVPQDV